MNQNGPSKILRLAEGGPMYNIIIAHPGGSNSMVYTVGSLLAQAPKTRQGGASLSSKVRPPSMKAVQRIRFQPPA